MIHLLKNNNIQSKLRFSQQLQQLQEQQQQNFQQAQQMRSASSTQSIQQQQQEQQMLQQQQHQQQFHMNAGTPLSPQPNNFQFAQQTLAQSNAQSLPSGGGGDQANANFPNGHGNSFYRPVSTSSKRSNGSSSLIRGESSTIMSAGTFVQNHHHHHQQQVAFNRPPTMTQSSNEMSNETKATMGGSSQSASKSAGKKRHSQVCHTSTLSYEEVAKLAKSCTTDQKIVLVARQVLGSGGSNGFQKATSTVQRLKKQRARSFKQKEERDAGRGTTTTRGDEEKLKLDTFNPRLAKRMLAEMKSGKKGCMQCYVKVVLPEEITHIMCTIFYRSSILQSDDGNNSIDLRRC